MQIAENVESNVRSYCRAFPAVFSKAEGSFLYDTAGRRYIDFFAGAGALNYGHNHPVLKEALLRHIESNGIAHGLDMATSAKLDFLENFADVILFPRGLQYKLMFPGPAGTTAIEAALKLARKVTGRQSVIAFQNAFHGMSLGALAVTSSHNHPVPPEAPRQHTHVLPFPSPGQSDMPGHFLDALDSFSERPAAIILETTQGEGGVNVAPIGWLRAVARVAKAKGIVLIVDDIQVGCGRTGSYFSFESAGLHPDIVCLAKSVSGFGLPLALTLIDPDLDQWAPGEHNGTFRGNNHAFCTGTAAIKHFWRDDIFSTEIAEKSRRIWSRLFELQGLFPDCRMRGTGLIFGVACPPGIAAELSRAAFKKGLVIETAGPDNEVLKLLPPLTTPMDVLDEGLSIIEASLHDVFEKQKPLDTNQVLKQA